MMRKAFWYLPGLLGLRPRPRWGSLQRSPIPPSCYCTPPLIKSSLWTPPSFNSYQPLATAFPKDAKRTRSAVIHQQFGERIIRFLKNPLSIEDRNFRHLIEKSGFQLLDLPEAGIRNALVVQVKGEKEVIRSVLVFILL